MNQCYATYNPPIISNYHHPPSQLQYASGSSNSTTSVTSPHLHIPPKSTNQSVTIRSTISAAIYPWSLGPCLSGALAFVRAFHGRAVVIAAAEADFGGHAVCDLEVGFGGHAVVCAVEAKL